MEDGCTVQELISLLEQANEDVLVRQCRFVIGNADPRQAKHVFAMLSDHFGNVEEAVQFMRYFQGTILAMPDDGEVAEIEINNRLESLAG